MFYEELLVVDIKGFFSVSAGNTEDDDVPRRRRKDSSVDSSKSSSTSNRRENEKEEMVKWEHDGQDSYIVESPDGELTLILQLEQFFEGEFETSFKLKT